MKVKEARQLIGQRICWKSRRDVLDYVNPRLHNGNLIDVQGKNAYVDINGFTDWLWLPDMLGVKVLAAVMTQELSKPELQMFTSCRLALIDVKEGRFEEAFRRLRADADKLRCHITQLNELLRF